MSLLQESLNTSLPYGRVFQGSGDQDPVDKDVRFYQHGLYFKADGSLAKDSPHNKQKIELINSLGINPEEPVLDMQEPDRAPVNPEIVAKLGDKTDEEVLAIADRLVKALSDNGTVVDFVPAMDQRDKNIRFIAKYAS
jgi:hypothetical protein